MKDKIIEEWMQREYPDLSDIRDLELSEGVKFVCKLGRLLDIAEENFICAILITKPSDNKDLKKVCPKCKGKRTVDDYGKVECDMCAWLY